MWAAPSLRGVTLARLARFFLTFLFSFSTKLLSFPFFSFHFFVSCCFLAVTQCPSGCETLGKPNAIAAAGAGLAIAAVRHSKAFFTKILSLQSDKKTQKRNMKAADTIVKMYHLDSAPRATSSSMAWMPRLNQGKASILFYIHAFLAYLMPFYRQDLLR